MRKKLLIFLLTLIGFTTANSQTIADYNLLIVAGSFSSDAETLFESMGHTATVVSAASLTTGYNYAPYDVILFMYDSALPPAMSEILTLNTNNQLGIIVMRGMPIVSFVDIGTSSNWSDADFIIGNNTHYITQAFATGILDLGFTYKSALSTVNPGNTILASAGGFGSLVVNNTYRRVLCPYYGHPNGMPWNADAELLMDRIIAWAAFDPGLGTNEPTAAQKIEVYPNPSADFIQVSGLTNTEDYKIYNVTGQQIGNGTMTGNEKINIQNLNNGMYFLKFNNAETFKFVKK